MKQTILRCVPIFVMATIVAACGGDQQKAADKQATETAQEPQSGEGIYRQRCAACHGMKGDMKINNAAELQQSKLDNAGIVSTIKNGRNGMPKFDGVMPEAEIALVADYVTTLRK